MCICTFTYICIYVYRHEVHTIRGLRTVDDTRTWLYMYTHIYKYIYTYIYIYICIHAMTKRLGYVTHYINII